MRTKSTNRGARSVNARTFHGACGKTVFRMAGVLGAWEETALTTKPDVRHAAREHAHILDNDPCKIVH